MAKKKDRTEKPEVAPLSSKKKFHFNAKHFLIGIAIFLLLVATLFTALLLFPLKTVNAETETDSSVCSNGIFIFPDAYKTNSTQYNRKFTGVKKLAGQKVFAQKLCFTPKHLLAENQEYSPSVYFVNSKIFPKYIEIKTKPYPKVDSELFNRENPLVPNETISLTTNKSNSLIDYYISTPEKNSKCQQESGNVKCDLVSLELKQGSEYDLEIWSSTGNKKLKTFWSKKVSTVKALYSDFASITANDVITNHHPEIIIGFNEKLIGIENVTLEALNADGTRTAIEISSEPLENQVKITLSQKLTASTKYELTIAKAVGESGAFLEAPYKLSFETSAGPAVISTNLKATGVPANGAIYIQFDQPIKLGQNLNSLISLGGKAFTASVYASTITIIPQGFAACESGNLTVAPGILNQFDVASATSYSVNFRTSCVTAVTVGYSVQGRPINAFIFGNGPHTALFHGTIHGSEAGTYYTMNSWIAELEANAAKIPADKRVIVIPNMNPDGLAKGQRLNVNGVDINRNFLTANWQQETYLTGGVVFPNGGGSAPFSEPETQTLRNVMLNYAPYITVSFHSAGSYVISNGAGAADAIASNYSAMSGYTYSSAAGSGTVFDYSITGSFDQWAADNGFTTILIEQSGNGNEIGRNRNALWHLVSM